MSPGLKTIEVGGAWRPALAQRRAAVATLSPAAVLMGVLMLAAFLARVLLAWHVAAPWEMPDELLYALTSRSFLSSGNYLFREHPLPITTIYPALISPAWLAGSTQTAYALIKVINAGLMTLGAIPLYLWARRLVAPLWAVLAVVLYLAMPGFIYSAEIMTENAFVPSAMLALFAIALALERPTLLRQVLALGSIALAAAARTQGLVFLPVLLTAIALVVLLDAIAAAPGMRWTAVLHKLRRFWPSLGGAVLAVVVYAVYELARGHSLSAGLGGYQAVSSAHYPVGPVLHWSAYHLGELALSVGLIPVSALIVLLGRACRRSTAPGAPERAFLALTTAAVPWIVLEAAAFASQFSLRIEERYMFVLDAPLFLALVVWLARGLPRSPKLVAGALLAPAAFVVALPYQSFFTEALFNDTFGLIPLWSLTARYGVNAGDIRLLVGIGALVIGILFAVVPRSQARVAIPVAIAGFLALSSGSVFAEVTFLASATRHAGALGGDPSWIDRAVGSHARVVLLDTDGLADAHVIWQAEFWNRSVRRVFGVTAQDPSGEPDIPAPIDRNGRIRPALAPGAPDATPHLVAAAPGVNLVGWRIAAAGQLVLWRIPGPLQLSSQVANVTPDGWTGATATYAWYGAAPGERQVVVAMSRTGLAGLPAAHVVLTVGPVGSRTVWERQAVTVPGGAARRVRLPVRRAPFAVVLSVTPTFSPSHYGVPSDTRQLGVRPVFSLSQ